MVDGHYRGVCAQALPSGSRANLKLRFNADFRQRCPEVLVLYQKRPGRDFLEPLFLDSVWLANDPLATHAGQGRGLQLLIPSGSRY